MQFDKINQATSLEQKVEKVWSSWTRSGIGLCSKRIYEKLQAYFDNLILFDVTADPLILKQLNRASYKLLVSLNQFGMRGIE